MPGLVLTVSTFTESRCAVSVAAASSFGTRGFASAVRGVAAVCLVVVMSVVTLSCTAGTAGCCGCKRKWLATTHSVVSNDSMKRDSFRMNCVGRGDIIRGGMPSAPYGADCSLPGRGEQFGFKQLYPVPENVHALVSKFFEAFSCIFGRAYAVGVAL